MHQLPGVAMANVMPPDDIVLEGWVEKRSAHLGVWRRRWAVLSSTTMYFFPVRCSHSQSLITPTEVVELSQCAAAVPIPYGARMHCFHLQVINDDKSHRDVFVSVGSGDEVQDWLATMSMRVEIAQEGWVAKQRGGKSCRWVSAPEHRWCVLTNTKLHFFKTKAQTLDFRQPQEITDISLIRSCMANDSDPNSFWINLKPEVSKSRGGWSLLMLGSGSEVEEWLDSLSQLGVSQVSDLDEVAASSRRISFSSLSMVNKVQMVLALLVYIVSPLDLVPDYIPIIGWADDAIAGLLLIFLVSTMAVTAATKQWGLKQPISAPGSSWLDPAVS